MLRTPIPAAETSWYPVARKRIFPKLRYARSERILQAVILWRGPAATMRARARGERAARAWEGKATNAEGRRNKVKDAPAEWIGVDSLQECYFV